MKPELDRELWGRIASVFDRALETSVDERDALLAQLCGSDQTIRPEVEEMLAAHEANQGLFAERRVVAADAESSFIDSILAPGTRVGPYRIAALIGGGGMGDVYRAERADGAYQQSVALKVLRPGYRTAELVRRFRIEREALARLVHPGIAAILDGGSLGDGRPYLVLELVNGSPITTYCDEHALSLRARLGLFVEVAKTVQFAHGRLVVHRDIKPSNILVQPDGTTRLLDFGIAKLLGLGTAASLAIDTTPDVRLLTPLYAAPEQLKGEAPGTATDVYALGALLFELLTGSQPFSAKGRTSAELERLILDAPAPAPSSVVASRAIARKLRGDLDRIVLMALRKEPDRRYLSAAQLGEDVERWLAGHPVLARPDTARYRFTKFVARNRALVAGGAALALLLAGFGATATIQAGRISRERDRAERERLAADGVLGILTGLFERADPNKHPGGDTLRVTGLLDEAEQEVDRLNGDPARQAALWRAVGHMRGARGEYGRAIGLLTKSYDRRRALFGHTDIEAARTRHEIAEELQAYRGSSEARPMLDSSLSELRALLGDEHQDVRVAMSELLMATTDSVRARALLAQLLDLERRAPSHDPTVVANWLDTQGNARFSEHRFAEAGELFEASLALLTKTLPPEHEYVRTEQQNLAMALVEQGKLSRAESLQRADVMMEDRIRSPALARGASREALAMTFAVEGRADSAERYERDALQLFSAGLAPHHWRIWSGTRNLAFILSARGRPEEGLQLLDSAIALATAGPDSASVGYLIAQRIPFELRLQRFTDASRSLSMAEQRLATSTSVNAPHRADVERYAGTIELARGHPERAAARFRSAVELTDSRADAGFKPGLHSCLLGVALAQLEQPAIARPLLGEGCTTYERRGLPDPLLIEWIAKARAQTGVTETARPSATQ